jgi:hypothetical protein
MDEIGQLIGVEVSFWGRKVVPLRFVWEGRRHEVKRVTLKFERNDGGKEFLGFAVDTGTMLAELLLDKKDLVWRINKCEPSCTWT